MTSDAHRQDPQLRVTETTAREKPREPSYLHRNVLEGGALCAKGACEVFRMKSENEHAAKVREYADRNDARERDATGIRASKDSRAHKRVRARLEVRLATIDACEDAARGQRFYVLTQATTLDIGDGGMRLECDGRVNSGQRVVLEVELGKGKLVERTGRVAWSADDDTGQHFMGVRFDDVWPGFVSDALRTLDP